MSSALQFNKLRLYRGNRCLCAQLTLEVVSGELLEITGANGAGKTSLLRAVAGLGGSDRIIWRDRAANGADGNAAKQLVYLAYQPELTLELSVCENLEFYRNLRRAQGRGQGQGQGQGQSVESALAYFEIDQLRDIPCMQLSEGQRRRVALCRLLTEPAPWWLLDEPEAALDQSAIELFESLLAKHLDEGNSALIATHRPLKLASGRIKHLELPC